MTLQLLYIKWNVNPEIFRVGGFALRFYSLLFAVAFILGFFLMKRMYQKDGQDERLLSPLLVYIVVGTILGARLGQVFFYEFSYFKNHPLEIILPFRISRDGFSWTGYQGLASHGGAIGIILALALYCKKYEQPFLWVIDRLVIVVALAGFFIRIGNLFNSEIIGKPTTFSYAFIFERVDLIPRHPSQLYEAVTYLFIFFILWAIFQRKHTQLKKGLLFGLFLVTVFSARIAIEFSKESQEPFEMSLPINMGQILSIPFILIGLYFVLRKITAKTIK